MLFNINGLKKLYRLPMYRPADILASIWTLPKEQFHFARREHSHQDSFLISRQGRKSNISIALFQIFILHTTCKISNTLNNFLHPVYGFLMSIKIYYTGIGSGKPIMIILIFKLGIQFFSNNGRPDILKHIKPTKEWVKRQFRVSSINCNFHVVFKLNLEEKSLVCRYPLLDRQTSWWIAKLRGPLANRNCTWMWWSCLKLRSVCQHVQCVLWNNGVS